jgi:hypothetical protein
MADINAAMLGYTGAVNACLQLLGAAVLNTFTNDPGGAWLSHVGFAFRCYIHHDDDS